MEGEKMPKITANVYVEGNYRVLPKNTGGNRGFVTTSDGIVMIDTPMQPKDAVKFRDKIAQKGELRYLINTHHHLDHTSGNYFFDAPIVSHIGVREMFYSPLEKFLPFTKPEGVTSIADIIRRRTRELDPKSLPLVRQYKVKAPTITFTEQLTLHVGKHTFELYHLPGHTESHIGVYIPEEKVFFVGDNLTSGVQPSLAQASPLDWIKSIKRIEDTDVDYIVPGHGKVSGKKELREFASFIQKCINIVEKAIEKGMSKEEAMDKLSFEEFYPAIHGGPEMQRMNVARLYDKLSK